MSLIVPNSGKIQLLDALLASEDMTLKLYKNNVTPTAYSVIGDFTECDFSGYSEKTLTAGDWGAASILGTEASSTYNDVQEWTCGATPNDVYGYFVVGVDSGILLWAELFYDDPPKTMTSGLTLGVTVIFTLNSAT